MTPEQLPLVLSTERPQPKRTPVRLERERLNAAALRVLHYLQVNGSATNVQLSAPDLGGLRFGGRLWEIKNDGWVIEKSHVSGGIWLYELKGMR